MESIKQIIRSSYTGSVVTANTVREEIAKRWGKSEAKNYDPYSNCLPFRRWLQLGFRVRKGQKSIPSLTFVPKFNEAGEQVSSYPKKVHLFYWLQTEPIASNPLT